MANTPTIKLFDRLYTDGFPSYTTLLMLSGNSRKGVYIDSSSFDRIIFEGKNLDYEYGRPVDGTLTKLIIADADGNPVQMLSGFKVDAGQVAGTVLLDFIAQLAARVQVNGVKYLGTDMDDSMQAYIGKDRLLGRGGEDTLNGGGAHDVLTGGSGNDTFLFPAGNDKDTITDFDADGGIGFQDLIGRAFADLDSTTEDGKNVILDFGDGDVLTLLNVEPEQITAADFTS